ncbi:hypothetical protein E2C01_005564 [Portunus trituberculatus]|uniref:Uncharacterized protein n=1 Tax=Portunus trituberculatus TaxID=210409 RepID=A0A5B7CTT8_PORTR|nr:hypothetical protein [Portunus trituberculatus]
MVWVWRVAASGIPGPGDAAANSSMSPLLTDTVRKKRRWGRSRRRDDPRGKQRSTERLFAWREMGQRVILRALRRLVLLFECKAKI